MCRRSSGTVALLVGLLTLGLSQVAGEQLSPRPTEEWISRLERPDRVADLKVSEIIAKLQLKPGQVVADIGAGPGVFSVPLAKAVSPGGKAYAVEVDQAFLDHISRKVKEQNVSNVVTVLGKYKDPSLPAKDVDLAFFHDVLHHIEDRAGYLRQLAPYLKPSGRIAVVDLDPVTGSHRDDPALRLSKDQVREWMADVGFKPVEEFDLFKDKWFVVYARQ